MAKGLFEVAFSATSTVAVAHNLNRSDLAVRIVIGGEARNDLLVRIDPDASDPRNQFTVELASSQTGTIYVLNGSGASYPAFMPSPDAAVGLAKSNTTATTDPGVGDDSDDGYRVGSRWINTSTEVEFFLVDATVGAAVWKESTDADTFDAHANSTANPHTTSLANIGSGTLAQLNTAVTDGTLDTASDPRDPNDHAATHVSGGSDQIAGENLAVAGSPVQWAPASATLGANFTGLNTALGDRVPQFSTGWISGGVLTDGTGLAVDVASGVGDLQNGTTLAELPWSAGSASVLPADTVSYIYVNSSGTITSALSEPDSDLNVTLGIAFTDGSGVIFLSGHTIGVENPRNKMHDYIQEVIGPLGVSGNIASINGSDGRQIDVTSGAYYIVDNRKTSTGATAVTYRLWYKDGSGGWTTVAAQDTVNNTNYDDGSGTLATLAAGEFRKDLLYITDNGDGDEYHLVLGQEAFADATLATNGDLPLAPDFMQEYAMRVAALVIEQGATALEDIFDERPFLGQSSSGVSTGGGTSIHGDLSGLLADNHPQYLLLSGSAARNTLTGTIDGSGGVVLLPSVATPAQTAEGSIVWDSDDDLLTVGTGAGRVILVDLTGTQSLSNKTLVTPTIASFTNAGHTHQDAAGAGQLDHGLALTGLGDDDHPQYLLLSGNAARNVLSGTMDAGTGIVLLPVSATPAQTAEGSIVWDSNDDLLTVGDGTGRKILADTDSTQSLSNKTLVAPTLASFINATHNHQNAAGGGQLDHGLALTGLGDDDHTQYTLLSGNAVRNNISGTFDFAGGGLILPQGLAPGPTAEGQIAWDTDGDFLRVGTGAGTINVIQSNTVAGGDLGGTYPNPTVTDLTITGESQGDLLYRGASAWVRLPAGTAGQILQANGAAAPTWVNRSNIAQYRQSANQIINTTATTITLDANDFQDSAFTRSGVNITINTAGIYRVAYSIFFDTNVSIDRRTVVGWVENNTVEIVPSRASGYARNNTDDDGSLSANFFVQLAATNSLRLRAQSTGTPEPAQSEGNHTWITLELVRAV